MYIYIYVHIIPGCGAQGTHLQASYNRIRAVLQPAISSLFRRIATVRNLSLLWADYISFHARTTGLITDAYAYQCLFYGLTLKPYECLSTA